MICVHSARAGSQFNGNRLPSTDFVKDSVATNRDGQAPAVPAASTLTPVGMNLMIGHQEDSSWF